MSYDYWQHLAQDVYDSARVGEDPSTLRCRAVRSARAGPAMAAAWGLMLAGTPLALLTDGAHGGAALCLIIGMGGPGAILLYFGLWRITRTARLTLSGSHLVVTYGWLPPRRTRRVAMTGVERFVAERRPLSQWQQFSSRRAVDLTYQPWWVGIELGGGDVVTVDVWLRPEHAERLARDLEGVLEEAKIRQASAGSYRG